MVEMGTLSHFQGILEVFWVRLLNARDVTSLMGNAGTNLVLWTRSCINLCSIPNPTALIVIYYRNCYRFRYGRWLLSRPVHNFLPCSLAGEIHFKSRSFISNFNRIMTYHWFHYLRSLRIRLRSAVERISSDTYPVSFYVLSRRPLTNMSFIQ